MKLSNDIQAFAGALGYEFAKPELLVRALTHPSMSSPHRDNNQRLEFLGDRVLGLVMAEAVFKADRGGAEGVLAPRFNALVRKETCADVARQINLGAVLKLGRSEQKSGGRRKETLLGDALEAVIAAIYLDGGFDAARDTVLRLWGSRIDKVDEDARDPKTSLQEWAQARGQTPPTYVEIAREGPDHQPTFTIEVRLSSGETAQATAGSKRQAEMAAARQIFEEISGNSN